MELTGRSGEEKAPLSITWGHPALLEECYPFPLTTAAHGRAFPGRGCSSCVPGSKDGNSSTQLTALPATPTAAERSQLLTQAAGSEKGDACRWPAKENIFRGFIAGAVFEANGGDKQTPPALPRACPPRSGQNKGSGRALLQRGPEASPAALPGRRKSKKSPKSPRPWGNLVLAATSPPSQPEPRNLPSWKGPTGVAEPSSWPHTLTNPCAPKLPGHPNPKPCVPNGAPRAPARCLPTTSTPRAQPQPVGGTRGLTGSPR